MSTSESALVASPRPGVVGAAKWLGRISAVLSTVLLATHVIVMYLGMTQSRAAQGGPDAAGVAMGWGFLFLGTLLLWIPVGLICLIGAILSLVAWRKHGSVQGRNAFFLSVAGPMIVILCAILWLAAVGFTAGLG